MDIHYPNSSPSGCRSHWCGWDLFEQSASWNWLIAAVPRERDHGCAEVDSGFAHCSRSWRVNVDSGQGSTVSSACRIHPSVRRLLEHRTIVSIVNSDCTPSRFDSNDAVLQLVLPPWRNHRHGCKNSAQLSAGTVRVSLPARSEWSHQWHLESNTFPWCMNRIWSSRTRDRNGSCEESSRYTEVNPSDIGWARCENGTSMRSNRRYPHEYPVENVNEERSVLDQNDYGNSKRTKRCKLYHGLQYAWATVSDRAAADGAKWRATADCTCMDMSEQCDRLSPLTLVVPPRSMCWYMSRRLHSEM